MLRTIRSVAVVAAVAFAGVGAMGMTAQEYGPEQTGYTYVWYHDAAKTQQGGTVADSGCGGWAGNYWVQRAYVPSGYYDAYPAFYCDGNVMMPL
jgi:hypothetical protein